MRINMEVIKDYEWISIDKLKFKQDSYQRNVQQSRKKTVYASIEEHGYWAHSIIILNQIYNIVDGQHRVLACKSNGISKVPCCVIRYASEEDEAKHFAFLNNHSTVLGPKDFWSARFQFKEKIATFLYELHSDNTSMLNQNIQLKEYPGKYKWTIPAVLMMINYSLQLKSPWSRGNEHYTLQRLHESSYEEVKTEVNLFLGFWQQAFPSKENMPIVYQQTIFRAILHFWTLLRQQGLLRQAVVGHGDPREVAARSLRQFDFNVPTFIKADHYGRVLQIVSHYNRNKKKTVKLD